MKIVRYVGFLTLNLFLRWPIWTLLFVLRPFEIFKYLFLVYPGTDSDLDGYCPRWLAKSWVFSKKPTIGGFISGGGLVLVVPNTVHDFKNGEKVSEEVVRRMVKIKNLTKAKAIALAGQLPGVVSRKGIPIGNPIVQGNKGTVFSVMETLNEAVNKHNINLKEAKVALIGVGYVGQLLLESLEKEGCHPIGVDVHGTPYYENRGAVSCADIVIVLTAKGSDFAPYAKELKEGAIVIDDTHPRIREKPEGIFFYKVALGLKGVNFTPRLPGYHNDWIPGCVVEAIVASATGSFNGEQSDFNQRAKELGFFAHMVQ
jgi:hypothetical protein